MGKKDALNNLKVFFKQLGTYQRENDKLLLNKKKVTQMKLQKYF